MANGYIGKISAVVTANTSDLSRKLQGAVKDVDRFAQTLNRSVSASAQQATASLEKIFTPLQRLERRLQTALQLNLRTDDEVRKIQQLVSVAEGINKPLERAAGSFSKLSLEVQGAFLPALNRAQTAAVNLSNTLEQSGSVSATSFRQVEQSVERTTQAIQRLTQAQQLASQSLTGNELQFANPRLFETLSANAATTRRAAALPASALVDGDIARQIRALEQYQNAAVEAAARVESLRLEPNVRPEVLIAAERRLESIIETATRAGQELSKVVDRDANAANAKRVEDAENAALVRREQARKALDQQLAASAKQRADAEIAALVKREQAALRLEGQLAAAAKQREDAELAAIQRREQAALRLDQQLAASAKKAADDEIAALVKKEQSALRIENQLAAAAKQRGDEEISALARREQTALRLENQLAAAARQREEAEQSALNRREQTALRLENQLAAAARQREEAEQSALNKREQTALRLENQLAAAAKQRADAEVNAVVKAEQARKRLDQQLADNDPRQRVRQRERAEELDRQRRDEELAVTRGRRDPLRGRLAEQGRRRVASLVGDVNLDSGDRFGGQAQRDIDALGTRVGAVRQQLEALPNSVRTQFIPALQQAQQQLIALQNSPGATADQIENAADAVLRIEQNANRARAALDFRGGGIEGLNRSLDDQAVQGYSAQLQLLERTLGRVSAEAAGPAVAAQNRLRQAIADTMQDGTIRTERQRQNLERLTTEAVEATAAVAGVGAGGLGRQVQRIGDIGRGGFDRFTLGVNQAVFAIDDFFSVTGGIEQRLRAVGNNLTQLGFIIGGTGGLVAALAAVLAGQGLAAFIRFSNGGASSEQQTKLLNDALARQKSLVEELAEAFRSLGDTLANRVFSEPAQEARRLGREIDEIAKKQRELLEARAADLDAGVQRSRVRQRVLQEEFDNSTDAGRRVFLQRQINEERRREQEAARAAVTRRPAAGEARVAVREALDAFFRAQRAGLRGEAAERQIRVDAARVDAAAAAVPVGNRPEDVLAQLRELRAAAAQAPEGTGRPFFFGQFGGGVNSPELVRLQQLITSLEAPLRQALDELSNQISRAAFVAAFEIEAAQGDVADAIRRGVRGAADFQAALDNTARQLEEAQAQVAAAQEIDDVDRREVEVRRAEGRVRDIEGRIDAINERAREVRLGRGFGGERTTAALSGLGDARFINEEAGLRARLRAAIDAEEQARRSVEAAIQRGDEVARQRAIADLEAAQAASDLAAAAAEAAIALEQAFARIRQTAENIISQSEGLANDAQRRLDEQDPRAPGAVGRDELRRDRDEAERQLIQDRRRERELQNRLDRERAEAANDPGVAAIDRRLEQLRSEREEAAADARLNGNFEDPRAAERRENEIARLEAEREEVIRRQTAGTQALIDKENQLIAARRRAIEEIQRQRDFEAEVARRRNPEGDAIRGLDLLENPGQRAGRELREQIADISAAFDRNVEAILDRAGGRPQDAQAELDAARADRDAAFERARQDAFRAQAPAIFGLADAVQNAILQGPSRAALEATDVSTVEGARELNRLLRGDDAARNQDLVQLQREANRLLQLIANGQPEVAN